MDSLFRVLLDPWKNILLELPSPLTTKFQMGGGGRGVSHLLGHLAADSRINFWKDLSRKSRKTLFPRRLEYLPSTTI